jgi:hypothetical protein
MMNVHMNLEKFQEPWIEDVAGRFHAQQAIVPTGAPATLVRQPRNSAQIGRLSSVVWHLTMRKGV